MVLSLDYLTPFRCYLQYSVDQFIQLFVLSRQFHQTEGFPNSPFSHFLFSGSHPECVSSWDWRPVLEGEEVQVTCHLEYNGLWPPVMQFMETTGDNMTATNITTFSTVNFTTMVWIVHSCNETTHTMKTLSVVFLPLIFMSFFFGRPKALRSQWNIPMNMFDFVTLTYDLQTWPRYPFSWTPCQNSSPYIVCLFGESDYRQTHGQTYDVKTITPVTSEAWGVINVNLSDFCSLSSGPCDISVHCRPRKQWFHHMYNIFPTSTRRRYSREWYNWIERTLLQLGHTTISISIPNIIHRCYRSVSCSVSYIKW